MAINKETKSYKVAIYTSYPEEKEMLIKLIKYLFNYDALTSSRIYGFNKKPNYEVRITSKYLAMVLVKEYRIPFGKKSLTVRVPEKIMNWPNKMKLSFIRGVIDGDGSIFNNSVKISSGSVLFLDDFKRILASLTISSGKIIKDNKTTNTFSLRITKKDDLKKIKSFYDCDYSYERKKEKIDKI